MGLPNFFSSLMWTAGSAYGASLAKEQSGRSERKATDAQQIARDLQDRVDKLVLACMAMWELLQEKTGLTEEQLLEKVKEIDLRDGREDGKFKPSEAPTPCPSCGRPISPRRTRCLFCGADNPQAKAMDTAL